MVRRRRILVVLIAVAGVGLLCWAILSVVLRPEPEYHGRTLTDWSLDLLTASAVTRSNTIHVLQTLEPEVAVPALSRQAQRRDSWLRRPFMAVSHRLPLGWRRAFINYHQPFRARDERLAALKALALFGTNAPADVLIQVLRDPDPHLANQAAVGLAGCGPSAVPGLSGALRDPNPRVRSLACSTLSQIGPPAAPAAAQVAGLLTDADPQLVAQAVHALTTLGPAGVSHLLPALQHPLPAVREKVAFALGAMGPSARGAVPALERLLNDEDVGVHEQARASLRAIAPRAYP